MPCSRTAKNRPYGAPASTSSCPLIKQLPKRSSSSRSAMRLRLSLSLCAQLVLSVFSVGAVLSPARAQELRRIHYGTTTSSAHLPIWVAKDAGFFAKNGLNVEPVQIRGGSLITMGIMSGQLQFYGAGAESIVAARIEGGVVVLLA